MGGVIAVLIVLMAIFAPFIAPQDPLAQDSYIRLQGASQAHWLGTDDFGRDVLSRIIWGSRVSLIIGITSVTFGMILGTLLGMIAGYYRGIVETVIMRGIDVLMCFPDLGSCHLRDGCSGRKFDQSRTHYQHRDDSTVCAACSRRSPVGDGAGLCDRGPPPPPPTLSASAFRGF